MSYKHNFSIKHLPNFVFGSFLAVVCTISVLSGGYTLLFTNDHTISTLLLTMVNMMGLALGTLNLIPNSIEYKVTEVPEEDLSLADQLKKDLAD